MKVFAISDLHLSTAVKKPMDIFGDGWQNHFEKISEDWQNKVADDDLVLLGGDMSWGLTLEEATPDYEKVATLKGRKYVVKGNHDYYWNSLSKMRAQFPTFQFLQNNAYRIPKYDILEDKNLSLDCEECIKDEQSVLNGNYQNNTDQLAIVLAGTRGWTFPENENDEENKKIFSRELQRLQLSLDSANDIKKDGDILIVMLHYPPFNANYQDSEVTSLLEKYDVKYVIYGHLHGKNARVTPRIKKNGIEYILTSCDLVDNKLSLIVEI